MVYSTEFLLSAQAICEAGQFIDSKGWVPATSGNFSMRLNDGLIAITSSGKHKGHLQPEDILLMDGNANALDGKKPSAEAGLHTSIYQHFPDAGAVLHPHPANSVLITKIFQHALVLEDYELLKAFKGISTHASRLVIPIFPNDQDIPRLAKQVERYWQTCETCYAYLIEGHGLYTWAETISDALRYLEALDYLFYCELQLHQTKTL